MPTEVNDAVARAAGPQGLAASIAEFNRASQSPERIAVRADLHSGPLVAAVRAGAGIDAHLRRVAAAFRAAGSRPFGPGYPPHVLVMPDSALASRLETAAPRFRRRADGGWDVEGPDGQWYRVSTVPPLAATPLARREGTYDFGTDHLAAGTVLAFHIGLGGGQITVPFRAAPPEAYDHVSFDADGLPDVGPRVAGQDRPLGPPPDRIRDGVNALAEAVKQHANTRHMGVVRTQASYYIDPQTGDKVAVVDAASIAYSNADDAAHVRWGRLAADELGNPTVIPTPDEDCGVGDPPGRPSVRNANPIRVPRDEDPD